ncbi:ROK family transcriptional regulator [Gracilinema caldarium]|uniref:ROK family protein n=1 Tax=Gracilinema caldarium (strain ATCC 51460 / DSM 7334 / H1) TaxID=744872 RepID=F8EZI0_GRAC1|nr:ROK family transcriptional regulator [Gracilinema caldarium]AEJ20203.1 ROK family protein [Gracilinema caldarium DSM 7334]
MSGLPLRSADIRERNVKIILGLLRQRKYLSQSEVVSLTGLRAPTIFRIFTDLEKQGLIRPVQLARYEEAQAGQTAGEEKKGRKPQYFEVVPEAFYSIGIDFWSRSATLALSDFSGEIRYVDEGLFPEDLDADTLVAALHGLIERALEICKIDISRLLGFGIGAPGRIDLDQGLILSYPRIRGLINFPLVARLQERYAVPVYLHNNASLAALAELKYGEARGSKSLFAFLVRSGVGGAYIENTQPFTVLGKTALEVGHLSFNCEGPHCTCGGQGCLEAYIAEDAILNRIQKVAPGTGLADLETVLDSPLGSRIQAGLDEPLHMFELAVRNIHTLFSPESYLIISRFPGYARLLKEALETRLSDLVHRAQDPIKIVSDVYDSRRIGRGATDLVIEQFLKEPQRPI